MFTPRRSIGKLMAGILALSIPSTLYGQWIIWGDETVASQCGIINAESLEFVARECDGALVLVTGQDLGFPNTFIDEDGTVFIDDEPSGYVAYEEDHDGFYTLWWLSDDGYVMDFDDIALEPFETDSVPEQFGDVPCAADDFWDQDADCGDQDNEELMQPIAQAPPSGNGAPCGLNVILFPLVGSLGLMLMSRFRRSY